MDEVVKLKKEAAEKIAEAERLEKLSALYPDLQKCTDRWKNVVYASKSVNPHVTDYEWKYSCGCCNDAAVVIMPYLETEHGRVYSYPEKFYVGNKSYWTGPRLYKDWRERISGIPETIIESISGAFRVSDEGEEE